MSGLGLKVEALLLIVLLRELESKILLADGRSHGHLSTGTPSGSEHEAGSELRTAGRAHDISLILLGERSEAGRCEALGQGTALVSSGLECMLRDLPVFVCAAWSFFHDILHHRAEIRRECAVPSLHGRSERRRLAVPRRRTVVGGRTTRESDRARMEYGRVRRQVGRALTSGHGDRGSEGVGRVGRLD